MSDVCVFYASEDRKVVAQLVKLLEKRMTVWWDRRIDEGRWAKHVAEQLPIAKLAIVVWSVVSIEKEIVLAEARRDRRTQNRHNDDPEKENGVKQKPAKILNQRGFRLVGAARFELATTCTPCRYATRLRYAPTREKYIRAGATIRLVSAQQLDDVLQLLLEY